MLSATQNGRKHWSSLSCGMKRVRSFLLSHFGSHMGKDDHRLHQKVTEGVRCLTQLGNKSGGLGELKRLAQHTQGWQFSNTFCMESSRGYWRRYVLPKIDLETGRAEYHGALPKVLASFGLPNGGVWKPPSGNDGTKPKGKEGKVKAARILPAPPLQAQLK